jgi:hypothetical protein
MSNATVNHRGRSVLSGLTAAGTNQATALPLVNHADHQFTTVGSSTGALLPLARLADSVSVWNGGAHTLAVYPPSGGQVNDGSVNSAYSLSAGTGTTFFATDALTWYASGASSGSTGTVTSIAAGAGLSGGTITTTGTIAIAAGGVGTTQIAANAVTAAKIATGTANSLLGFDNSGNAATVAVSTGLALSGGNLTGTLGTITSITAGEGLTGGTITSSGTIALNLGLSAAFASRNLIM